jgi:hypothetical protein
MMTVGELSQRLSTLAPDMPVMIEVDVGEVITVDITAALAGIAISHPARLAFVLTADAAEIAAFAE